VQGYGEHVTTLGGYGDAFNGGTYPDYRRWYTHLFDGTSSAGATVAGAVAALQGFAVANFGHALSPAQIRSRLVSTGTAQPAPDAASRPIGPRPNLYAAAGGTDIHPPIYPVNAPPEFDDSSGCGTTLGLPTLFASETTLDVSSSDPDPSRRVTLSASRLPSYATFTQASGNPAHGRLSLHPGVIDLLMGMFEPAGGVTVTAAGDDGRVATCDIPVRLLLLDSSTPAPARPAPPAPVLSPAAAVTPVAEPVTAPMLTEVGSEIPTATPRPMPAPESTPSPVA
jgi:hypothetical protein